jgi:hypothetical protein
MTLLILQQKFNFPQNSWRTGTLQSENPRLPGITRRKTRTFCSNQFHFRGDKKNSVLVRL